MAKKIFVTVGHFIIASDKKKYYCRGYKTVQVPYNKKFNLNNFDFKVARELITAVAEIAHLSDLNNLFIERINGKPLPRPTGLYKKVDWATGETEVDDYKVYTTVQKILKKIHDPIGESE